MFRSRKPFVRNYYEHVRVRSRGYLPHWEATNGIYFVTFRLADALPAHIIEKLKLEREEIVRRNAREEDARAGRPRYGGRDGRATIRGSGGEVSFLDRVELSRLFALRVDHYLDAGMGSCVLRDDRAAKIVADAFLFFHNDRYRLDTWSVMPNHAHVIFQPLRDWRLDRILHSWKSYSSKEINRALGRRGQLWQEEYFDHLIRDAEELRELGGYVRDNPAKAGLKEWPWVWSNKELR